MLPNEASVAGESGGSGDGDRASANGNGPGSGDGAGPGSAPVAADDAATLTAKQARNGLSVKVLANDSDADGAKTIDKKSLTILDEPDHGSATVRKGAVFYVPDDGYDGPDSFTYTIRDKTGLVSNTATVDLDVSGGGGAGGGTGGPPTGGTAPVAVADAATLSAKQARNGLSVKVLANDSDADGAKTLDKQSLTIVDQPDHGTATIRKGAVFYVPDEGYDGADRFSYTVADKTGLVSNIATVGLDVPGGGNTGGPGNGGGPSGGVGLVGTALFPEIVELTDKGEKASLKKNGILLGFGGDDKLAGATDTDHWLVGGSGDDDYTVNRFAFTIIQETGGDPDDSVSIKGLRSFDDLGGGVTLAVDGRHLFAVSASGAIVGLIDWQSAAGRIETFDLGFDKFDFDAFREVALAPGLFRGNFSWDSFAQLFAPFGLTQADADGMERLVDDIRALPTELGSTPSVALAEDGGPGNGGAPSGAAPVAVADEATLTAKQARNGVSIKVLANDSDADGAKTLDKKSLTIVDEPDHGTATIKKGAVFYAPDTGYDGADGFSYTVADKTGLISNIATVALDIPGGGNTGGPGNGGGPSGGAAPVAENDAATLTAKQAQKGVSIKVLANDSDADGARTLDKQSLTIVDEPDHGTATIKKGAVFYVPDDGYDGADGFSYTVADKTGLVSNVAVVDLEIPAGGNTGGPGGGGPPSGVDLEPAELFPRVVELSDADDKASLKKSGILLGLGGEDSLSTAKSFSSYWLVGGSGDDDYTVGFKGLTLVQDIGGDDGDTLTIKGIRSLDDLANGVPFTVDDRHLFILGPREGFNGFVAIMDWQDPDSRIETVDFGFDSFTFSEFRALMLDPGEFFGNISWDRFVQEFDQIGLTRDVVDGMVRLADDIAALPPDLGSASEPRSLSDFSDGLIA